MGTAASGESRVWFTISHGIVNEVYHLRSDQANTRDLLMGKLTHGAGGPILLAADAGRPPLG